MNANTSKRSYTHIASRLFNVPLMVHPAKLDAIIHGIGPRLGIDVDQEAYIVGFPRAESKPYRLENGIGIISVRGALSHRSSISAPSTYLLGYDDIASELRAALEDTNVKDIVMEFDSPGGEVSGAFQLAEEIYRGRSVKPIHAMVTDMAASAGYLLASAATSITATNTSITGSIGVVMRHADYSKALANEGIKVTHIHAGARKVDGNPYEPLTAEVKRDMQASVDYYYGLFVDAVALYRGGVGLNRDAIRNTEAAVFVADQALEIGLIDHIDSPDALFERLLALRESNGFVSQSEVLTMSEDREKLIALEASNVDLKSKLIASESMVADLNAQLEAVRQQLSVESDKAKSAEAQLQAQREAARKLAVESLFADLKQELSAERAAPYLAMSDDSFAAISADLRALSAHVVDPKLFFETAVSGASQDSNVIDLGAQLFKQVAGVK
jgi:signal peptide peptidase SppA